MEGLGLSPDLRGTKPPVSLGLTKLQLSRLIRQVELTGDSSQSFLRCFSQVIILKFGSNKIFHFSLKKKKMELTTTATVIVITVTPY